MTGLNWNTGNQAEDGCSRVPSSFWSGCPTWPAPQRKGGSDPGVQGCGPGQGCGLGGPEGLAKCLLSLVDLDGDRHWVSLFTDPTGWRVPPWLGDLWDLVSG